MPLPRVDIVDGGGVLLSHSEYVHDQQKVGAWPDWLDETGEPTGYRDRSNSGQSEVTRYYRCPWSKRHEARAYLLGYSFSEAIPLKNDPLANRFWGFAPGLDAPPELPTLANLNRVIPLQDPERPWLFCDEAEIVQGQGAVVQSPYSTLRDSAGNLIDDAGHVIKDREAQPPFLIPCAHYVDNADPRRAHALAGDKDVQVVVSEIDQSPRFSDGYALIRATFRQKPYTILSDEALVETDRFGDRNELRRWVERHEEPGLEALPLARLAQEGNQLKFAEGPFKGQTIPEAGVVQYPLATLVYIWYDVPDLPRSAFYTCLGAVNDREFDGFRGTPIYPKETLLCLPMRYRFRTGPTGRILWTIEYRFAYRPQKWNRFPAGDGHHYLATWGGDSIIGERVYRSAGFNLLFEVPPPVRYLN